MKNATIIFELNDTTSLAGPHLRTPVSAPHSTVTIAELFLRNYADTVARPLSVDQLLICSEANALLRFPMYGSGPVHTNGTHSLVGSQL